MENLNSVSGQILLEGTQQGIPNVLVAISSKDVFGVFGRLPGSTADTFVRVGSTVTDINGEFSISFEDVEQTEKTTTPTNPFTKLKRQGRNLYLEVRGPDQEGKRDEDLVLYKSSQIREQAGQNERFLIHIPKSKLVKAGVPLPGAGEGAEAFAAELGANIGAAQDLKNKVREVLKTKVDQARTFESDKDEKFLTPFSNGISRIPDSLRLSKTNFVKEGDSVEQVTKDNILQRLTAINNPGAADKSPKPRGVIHLTQEQKSKYFKPEYLNAQQGEYELPEDQSKEIFETILKSSKNGDNDTAQLLMRHPLEKYSREKSEAEKAFLAHLGLGEDKKNDPQPDKDNTPPGGLQPADAIRDVPLYVAKQMEHVVAPEGPVLFGVGSRATLQEIQNNISALRMRAGPADSPAYFDFHSIKIAFEHVWQEAIDEGVLNLAKDAYDEIVELGGTPPASPGGKVHVQQLKKEGRTVVRINPGVNRKGPKVVQEEFPHSSQVWEKLSYPQKQQLEKLAETIKTLKRSAVFNVTSLIQKAQREGNAIIQSARAVTKRPESRPGERRGSFVYRDGHWVKENDNRTVAPKEKDVDSIISELEERLKKSYSFVTFAANQRERSVNFGLLLTYRQRWEPVAYQVGELVKTIPLAPRESRKYSKKTVVKKKREVKEMENSLQILKTDSSQTSRAESEIVENATAKTGFQQNSQGSASYGVVSGSTSTNFTGEAGRESKDLKKSFRENVFKSAQEYKNDRKVEISTESSYDSEVTESGEISNPNDELPVTYLFYELQRRYKVTERLHRLLPVVFVAQEVPKPHEIDEDWLLTHDWIIRRVLLDDSFLPALNFLSSIASDAFVLEEMDEELERQRKMVDDTRISFEMLRRATESHFRALQKAVSEQAGVTADRDPWDPIPLAGDVLNLGESVIKGIGGLFGLGGGGDDDKEAARIRREAAMEALERAESQQKETLVQLKGEIDKLHALAEKYNQRLSEKLQKETQIARLRVHVKDNILHYMHAIWRQEHPDQRFFRLFNVKVPALQGNVRLQIKAAPNAATLDTHYAPGVTAHEFRFKPNIGNEFTTLEQVAEVDNLLGYKGNYMIFPLKQSNALTDFMMAPYIDTELGLKDPDEFGNWTLEEFLQYVLCLKAELPQPEFDALIPQLTAHYKKLLTDPLRQGEELIVPSGSLYIEALPGAHPILEDFKLVHRAIDVKKVQAEVRKMEMENIRLAARVLKGELEDPDVEKRVVVEKNGVDANININE